MPASLVGPWSLWMLVLLQACALPQCVAWSLPPRTPSETLSRGRHALSYRADVLVSCYWKPPSEARREEQWCTPHVGAKPEVPALCDIGVLTLQQEG